MPCFGQQTLPALLHWLKGIHVADIAHKSTSKKGKEANMRANIPRVHARVKQVYHRLLDQSLMRPGPVKFSALGIDQQPQPLHRPGADYHSGLPIGHQAIDQRAQQSRRQRVGAEMSCDWPWNSVHQCGDLVCDDHR
jgi:hypothetical protein